MFDKNHLLPGDALKRVLSAIPERQETTERLRIEECYGRILASPVVAPEDLPAFARSTVDGFAVHSSDTFGARESLPAYINVKGEVFMGVAPDFSIGKGECARIPTGGMLPPGADAVVMLEYAQTVSDDMIEVMKPVAPHENIIRRGEDVEEGMLVLTRGRRLRPQDIGALAGLGITGVDVFTKPVVALVSTGDEIVPPGTPLRPGQVRDINSFTLAGLISEHGGVPVKKGIFSDEYGVIRGAIEEALSAADMVLVSGGTSAGVKDMTSTIIDDIGKPGVLFHGVSLKPGKPMIGGVIGNTPLFGLPGHPAAAVVCFDLFILPLLERLSGLDTGKCFPRTVRARMAKSIASSAGREDHIRVALERQGDELLAVPVLGKSGLITTLVRADGMVGIPQEKLGLDAGEEVTVKLF
ncbi:MAG: molybdopterin molybdenumtransferase MoeA [Alphaproteobacteria bacterium]|uniref:Molybdopterin molybdenumtransferase n=1 Tax=Candidatus Nitrobium versatile TaxID=2884831 RepID=A0A953J401_9BACT|nr:molybdopterin molybdenumtransferase MoeA [Candidatus Nitrobium versatile]